MGRGLRHWLTALALGLWATSTTSAPYCDEIRTLAKMHNYYFAMLSLEGNARQRAAAQLFPMTASIDAETYLTELDPEFDHSQWMNVHAMAAEMASNIITGIDYTNKSLAPHTNNVEWLRRLVSGAPCPLGPEFTDPEGLTNRQTLETPVGAPSASSKKPAEQRSELPTMFLLIILGASAALFGGYHLWKSRIVRRFRADRLPRTLVEMVLDLVATSPDGTSDVQSVKALDISLGGMKVRLDAPIDATARLELQLPIGPRAASIVWSNPHYAGILFDTQLSEKEFNDLISQKETAPGFPRAETA